jgi:uncharacterized membrane protein
MLFIILSILLFSYNNVLWKTNLKFIPITFLVSYRAFFTSTISLIILFTFFSIDNITITGFFKITLGSLFGVIGLFSMLSVIKKASLQWLGIYNLVGVIFTILYLWIFDAIEIKKHLLGVLVIVLGFISFIYTNKNTQLKIAIKQHLTLFLMMICFSCSSLLHWKNLTSNAPPLLIIANQEFIVFLAGILFTFKQGNSTVYKSYLKMHFKRVLLMSIVVFLAILFSFLGLKETNPITTSLLFLATPLTTILFSAFFFKEKLSYKNIIFISIIVIGAFVLHYQSN